MGAIRFRSDDDLADACATLRQADPELIGLIMDRVGQPVLRQRSADYAGMAGVVVGQQLSTASAAAILGRLEAMLRPLTSSALLSAGVDQLRECGLSSGKVRTLRVLAEACEAGKLAGLSAHHVDPAKVRAELLDINGIGPWTADIVLLFCLGHADAWPSGDLALQAAAGRLIGRSARLSPRELDQLGERWRPYRGAAAHLLWAFYRAMDPWPSTGLTGRPITPNTPPESGA